MHIRAWAMPFQVQILHWHELWTKHTLEVCWCLHKPLMEYNVKTSAKSRTLVSGSANLWKVLLECRFFSDLETRVRVRTRNANKKHAATCTKYHKVRIHDIWECSITYIAPSLWVCRTCRKRIDAALVSLDISFGCRPSRMVVTTRRCHLRSRKHSAE